MNYLGDLYLSKAIAELKRDNGERLVRVLYLRFWANYTLADVGEELGVRQERVRQLEVKALRILKNKLRKSEFADFMGATI